MTATPATRLERYLLATLVGLLAGLIVGLYLADPVAFRGFFAWPNGGIWSNLLASLLLGIPAVYAILRRLARQHAEHLHLLHTHHVEHLEALRLHHENLVHVVRALPPPL
jgi:hypothetical protein